jgi:hypothetical protein
VLLQLGVSPGLGVVLCQQRLWWSSTAGKAAGSMFVDECQAAQSQGLLSLTVMVLP